MVRRAFLAVVVGVTAALLVGLVAESLAAELLQPARDGVRTMGLSLAAIVGIGASGATLLVASGRRGQGLGLYALVSVAAVAFFVWIGGRIPPRARLVLAASDRAELREFHDEAAGLRGIEHPTLGFRLPHPTLALSPSREIADEMRAAAAPGWADAHQIWAFETPDHGVSVMIDLSRAEAADAASLEALAHSVTGPLEAAGHRVERDAPTGPPGCMREGMRAALTNGGRVAGVLFTLAQGSRAFRLVVTVVSDGSGDWARWTHDVTLACERE
jgi:hypothetical protein